MTAADQHPATRRWPALSLSGCVGALAGFLPALTPSLLPRPAFFLGLAAGVAAAIGYGVFVGIAHVAHRVGVPALPTQRRRGATIVLAGIWAVAFTVGIPLAASWQNDIRASMGLPPEAVGFLTAAVAAAASFAGLLALGRLIGRLTHAIFGRLHVHLPRWLAFVTAVTAVGLTAYLLAAQLLLPALTWVADRAYAGKNTGSAEWVQPTDSPERSGGPGSLIGWDTLGREGRAFIASGPRASDIAEFSGAPAREPIRVYAGLESAATPDQRADLVLAELERTGAFDREVLVVAGVAGTGWLEPQSIDGVEYLWNGDSAIAASQYSYLPSWISFLVDQERAKAEGQALFDTVWRSWSALPPDARPQLIVYGLSLGSFSVQSAFATEGDIAARTDGAILAGTPSFTEPWGTISAGRDPGSPQWQPIVRDGAGARFADDDSDLRALGPWQQPRLAYLQHANDPVVWWSFDLIGQRPDWLVEPRGPAVSPRMHWLPIITFLQVTVDQFFGVNQPNGYGHNYSLHMAQTWVDVTGSPDAWDDSDTERLQRRLTG